MTRELQALWDHYQKFQAEGQWLKELAVLKAINREDPEDLAVYKMLAELYRRNNLTEECMDQYRVLVDYFLREHGPRAESTGGGQHASVEDEYAVVVKQQIAAGESRVREFKSTIRKNLKSGAYDDSITDAALRTIAGFLNSEGGTLYIGVGDDGTVLGLEDDGFSSADHFQRFLIDKVKTHLGVPAAAALNTAVVQLEESHEVCVIECRRSDKLVFMRSAKYREVCFIRTGPTTVELPPSQILDYAAGRERLHSGLQHPPLSVPSSDA